MNPISIRNRSVSQTDAIQRQFRAAQMRQLFASIEAQLTDPCLLEMTRQMRDTVMSNPEFAGEGERPLSPAAEFFLKQIVEIVRERAVEWPPKFTFDDGYTEVGQELVEAGLVAQSTDEDGCVTYRLTVAGRAWRAA